MVGTFTNFPILCPSLLTKHCSQTQVSPQTGKSATPTPKTYRITSTTARTSPAGNHRTTPTRKSSKSTWPHIIPAQPRSQAPTRQRTKSAQRIYSSNTPDRGVRRVGRNRISHGASRRHDRFSKDMSSRSKVGKRRWVTLLLVRVIAAVQGRKVIWGFSGKDRCRKSLRMLLLRSSRAR